MNGIDDILTDLSVPQARQQQAPADVYDPHTEPEALTCEHCGKAKPWGWWEPSKPQHRRWPPRWCPPTVSPCHDCAPKVAGHLDELAAMQRRQKRAGVPWRYRGYKLSRMTYQEPRESWASFKGRILQRNKGPRKVLGIAGAAAKAYLALVEWEPAHGSMLLYGPVGTGKTLLLCALANRLLEASPRREVDLIDSGRLVHLTPRQEAYARSRGLHMATVQSPATESLVYITTEELAEREALRWKGDPQPSAQAAEAAVLILDELWGEAAPSKAEVKGVKRVIEYRYTRGLPTLMASNAPPDELLDERRCPYGARMADRFAELLQGGTYSVGGESWRR